MYIKKEKYVGYSIPIIINGESVNFLLDTGAQKSVIKLKVVREIGLETMPARIKIKGASGQNNLVKQICYINLTLDTIMINGIEMLVLEGRSALLYHDCAGIIGADLLYKLNFCLSIKNNQFIIFGLADISGNEILNLSLKDGQHCNAIIDTASKESWITEDSNICFYGKYTYGISVIKSIKGIAFKRNKIYNSIVFYTKYHNIEYLTIRAGRNVVRQGKKIDIVLGLDTLQNITFFHKNGEIILSDDCQQEVRT